jgi:hypothetical protein
MKSKFEIIKKRVTAGRSKRTQFAAIVYNVRPGDMKMVLEMAHQNNVGLLHVTNHQTEAENSNGPEYWGFLLLNFRQDEKCGCIDLNECTSFTDKCHEYAGCVNSVGSYECQCALPLIGLTEKI